MILLRPLFIVTKPSDKNPATFNIRKGISILTLSMKLYENIEDKSRPANGHY